MTKRAVIVGVNDYSMQNINSLSMCVRDARAFHHLLVDAFGFARENIFTYLDRAADSARILQALRFCIANSEAGDVICFYYSGHGTTLPSPNDASQFYECIIPASGRWISDHELFLLTEGLQPSFVNFTCVFDSCFSGGMSLETQARTPPMEQSLVDRIVNNLKTLIPCGLLLSPEDRLVCKNNVHNVRLENGRIDLDPDPNFTTVQLAKTTLISGCRPDELSYEGPVGSAVQNGLMTRSIIDMVVTCPFDIDHRTMVHQLNTRVAAHAAALFPGEGIVQQPQLVGQNNRMDEHFLAAFTDSR